VNVDALTSRVESTGPARRRLLRGLGFLFAGLLIAIALLLLLLRIVLAGMPERADRVKAWVERETRLRLEFSSLDARLRWYGPELVLYDLRILDRDSLQPMLAMREGSCRARSLECTARRRVRRRTREFRRTSGDGAASRGRQHPSARVERTARGPAPFRS
jgi:uncharacterized protein YhdP